MSICLPRRCPAVPEPAVGFEVELLEVGTLLRDETRACQRMVST